MDADDLKRQGVAAKIELHETQASFDATRRGIVEAMLSATTEREAAGLVWRLQAVDAVRADLLTKAANVEIADHEERMSAYQD